jgi:hypothetical protein
MIFLGAVQGQAGTTAHYLVARGFVVADASHVMPFESLRLPFTLVFAFFLFDEVPDVITMIGASIVLAATTYVALASVTSPQAGLRRDEGSINRTPFRTRARCCHQCIEVAAHDIDSLIYTIGIIE